MSTTTPTLFDDAARSAAVIDAVAASVAANAPVSAVRRRARYIVIEGVDGVGKTTQCNRLAAYLRSKGHSVLETREPGTAHLPLTMTLRSLMLDKQYDAVMTPVAREYISQAIRSIHIDKLITNALQSYDYIIQDRGILSGLAYGKACGNDMLGLVVMMTLTCSNVGNPLALYSDVLLLQSDITRSTARLATKSAEFTSGDVIEERGVSFMEQVRKNMTQFGTQYFNTTTIDIGANDSIDDVFHKIVNILQV